MRALHEVDKVIDAVVRSINARDWDTNHVQYWEGVLRELEQERKQILKEEQD